MKRTLQLGLLLSVGAVFLLYFIIATEQEEALTIYAASSLTDVFADLIDSFNATHDIDITLNLAGSSTLVTQILQGAPADLFASASEAHMTQLIDAGLIDQQRVSIFAENELVLLVPASNPAGIESIGDIAGENILLVFAAQGVPVRLYTDELLGRLAVLYGSDFGARVMANVVSEEINVRQVVARIALGEADAGIVYRTDVTSGIAHKVTIIELPPSVDSPVARYPIAPLITSKHIQSAQLFIDFLQSKQAQAILVSWGFCLPDETAMLSATPEATREIHGQTIENAKHCA